MQGRRARLVKDCTHWLQTACSTLGTNLPMMKASVWPSTVPSQTSTEPNASPKTAPAASARIDPGNSTVTATVYKVCRQKGRCLMVSNLVGSSCQATLH